MPLSPDERAELLRSMPALAAGGDRAELIAWAIPRVRRVADELDDSPGHDQVRAACIRLARDLFEGDDLEAAYARAAVAIEAYAEDVASGDPHVLLVRQPAWAGLCALELAAARRDAPSGLATAIEVARAGFAALGRGGAGDGEILWAMAEQAEDAGWDGRASALLAAAAAATFADPDNAAQVRLLRGLSLAERDAPEAAEALAAVADDEACPPRARVHACWVLGHLVAGHGGAEWLRQALALVDPEEEPDTVTRIREALAARQA